ncbi:MAG: DUF2073 domain-containing protein [Candidatus Micrarchaeota archaeon]
MVLKLEFISADALSGKDSGEKLDLILGLVKQDSIVILEASLSREEEKNLIRKTMAVVSKKFPGIEIASLGVASKDLRAQLIEWLGGRNSGLTVIGPSTIVKEIKKDPGKLRLLTSK